MVVGVKTGLGILSVVVNFVGYVPYFKDVLQHRTKPHIFSWLVWAVLASIGFAVQVTHHAGAGAWVMGFTALATLSIFLLSLGNGEKHPARVDWISLVLAAVALTWWFVTKDPLASIILTTVVDVAGGFFPTFRKSYRKPFEETISLYVMYAIAWSLSLAALEKVDLINVFAPSVFIAVNTVLIIFLVVRRRALRIGDLPQR